MSESSPAVKISYLDKSYKEARDELLARAPIISKGLWTDINSSELLVAFLELVLGLNDQLMFYFDHQSNEAFLSRSDERKNVIAHCNMIGYRLGSWSPAKGNVIVQLNTTAPIQEGYISIPKYTEFSSVAGLSYYTTDAAYLSIVNPITSLSVAQGTPTNIEYVSNGKADQQYIIPSTYVAEGSITVSINDLDWMYVDDGFAKSGPFSEHYVLRNDSNNNIYVMFGDNIIGFIPPEGSIIKIYWSDTLGPAGNVRAGQVFQLKSTNPISGISITSSTNFSGGSKPETTDEAKKLAPMMLRSLWRGVSRDDFIALTEHFPGVRQASVLDINDFPLYSFQVSYYEVIVVVIPEEGEYLSSQFKLDLMQYLEERKYVTCDVKIRDPEYVRVDIEATIFKYVGHDDKTVIADIEKALRDFFIIASSPIASYRMTGKIEGRVLGEDLRFSVLVSIIQAISGISHVEMISPKTDILINFGQIPVLGNLILSVSDINEYTSGTYAMLREL
jgi:hypothetical protein